MTPRSMSYAVHHVLEQGRSFLVRTGNEAYARPLGGVFSGTLGAHYRHVLDHFLCLIEGIRTGEVNYDQRRRNPQLENSVEQALLVTEALAAEFECLPQSVLERECVVTYSVGYRDETQAVHSNIAREIIFCVGHAIHHYAILKLLCAEAKVELPYEFGIAPSTLKHLEMAARS